MGELLNLIRLRLRMTRYAAAEFLTGSKLRVCVVVGLVVLFWLLMLAMFLDAFMFLRSFRTIGLILLDYLFAFFFVSLLVMMTISNAIIAYTSIYRSEETTFLFALPIRAENTFAYRGSDSIAFSSWGMATLVVPMILAYSIVFSVPPSFFIIAFALTFLFILFAMELGAFLALAVALVLPRHRRTTLLTLGVLLVGSIAAWVLPLLRQETSQMFSEGSIKAVMDQIAFCQHWALPSRWVSQGLLSAARGELGGATVLVLTLLANVMFLGLVTYRLGHYAYRHTWGTIQGTSTKRHYRPGGLLDAVLRVVLSFLPRRLRLLVAKDLKTFFRDPTQWSQFLLFFGLLGLYIINLPRFELESLQAYWRSLISSLNLGATSLTLATLTSRFIFPQLSLEGRRIWVTGLLPMRRALILWGKFFFAAVGTFLISATLIALSDLLLGLPFWTLAVHLLVVACVCCGLNGLAVGLGALYPKTGTDSPSKIVSSFGGTLNLICSICFLAVALAPVIAPLHLHRLGMLAGPQFVFWLVAGVTGVVIVSALVCVIPMLAGARAFSRMEF